MCSSANRDEARRSMPASDGVAATSWSRPTTTCGSTPDWLDRAGEALETLRVRLRRRQGSAALGRTAAGVDTGPRRQAVGGDRAPRLRRRADSRSSRRRTAFRSASTWRSGARRSIAPASGTTASAAEGHAARAGSARVDVPRARRGPARLVRAVDGRPARHPGRSPEQAVLPALVLLERHQPRAALPQRVDRHAGAGEHGGGLLTRAAHLRCAALLLPQGAARGAPLAA